MTTTNSEGRGYYSTEESARAAGYCGATNRNGEPCLLPEGWGTPGSQGGRCKFHGGASTGPRDTEYLESNGHADGNPGGGAPPRNSNARVHGVFSSDDAMDARLRAGEGDVDAIHSLALLEYDILKTSRENAPDMDEDRRRELAHEYALNSQKEARASIDFFERGFAWANEKTFETEDGPVTVEQVRVNPTLGASSRLTHRALEIWDELRALPKYRDE